MGPYVLRPLSMVQDHGRPMLIDEATVPTGTMALTLAW
jgi:hypothetical protein